MLVTSSTPFFHGAVATSRNPPQVEMVLVVRGTFRLVPGELEPIEALEQGLLSGDRFEDEDDERRGQLLYASDFADFKPRAEVLFRGTCHAPKRRAVIGCAVRIELGKWSKELRVAGDRTWKSGGLMSDPQPFTAMPLDFSKSFGGPGFAPNPVGKGHQDDALPNVELLDHRVRSRSDVPPPAGFGPINPSWPQRASKVGKDYGLAYQRSRAPWYASDFDWTHFQAAPADQQLEGYLRGDETLRLQHLHPTHASLTTSLPGRRVRAFVKDDRDDFREIPMRLDTLFIDGDAERVYLTWRGLTAARESDLEDVRTVLIADEALGERPRDEAHYRAALEDFEADPTGVLAELPPEWMAAVEADDDALFPRGGSADPSPSPLERALGEQLGESFVGPPREAVRDASAQLAALPKGEETLELAATGLDKLDDRAPPPKSIKPGVLPDTALRAQMRKVLEQVEQLRAVERERDITIEGLDDLAQLPFNERFVELDPEYVPPTEPLSDDEPGPGRDMSERDWSGRDLRGADLRSANLWRADLSQADLRGADLEGANLSLATLYKTKLGDAKLRGANLSRVNAAHVQAAGADLRDTDIDMAVFERGDLGGARLDGAKGAYIVFDRVNLRKASLRGTTLDRSELAKADIGEADFTRAEARTCLFSEVQGEDANFTDANLEGTSFASAELRRARFIGARLHKSSFDKSSLCGVDFSYATLSEAHLPGADASDARFFRADMRDSRCYRANLCRAQIIEANLFGADLCKADLRNAQCMRSSLYEAKLLDTLTAGCDFTEANLERVVRRPS